MKSYSAALPITIKSFHMRRDSDGERDLMSHAMMTQFHYQFMACIDFLDSIGVIAEPRLDHSRRVLAVLCINSRFGFDLISENRILHSGPAKLETSRRRSGIFHRLQHHQRGYLHSSLSFFDSRLKLKQEHDEPSSAASLRAASFSRRLCSCFSIIMRCCLM